MNHLLKLVLIFVMSHLCQAGGGDGVMVKVQSVDVPDISRFGAWNLPTPWEGKVLTHGCEWANFLGFGKYDGNSPLKLQTELISTTGLSGRSGIYFGLNTNQFIAVTLEKEYSGGNFTTRIAVNGMIDAHNTFTAGVEDFTNGNTHWIGGVMEVEFEPNPLRMTKLSFKDMNQEHQFPKVVDGVNQAIKKYGEKYITGGFGAYCFQGFTRHQKVKLNGKEVTFN